MKQLFLPLAVLLLSVSTLHTAAAQSADLLSQIYTHIEAKYGLSHTSVGDLRLKSRYTTQHNQAEHLYFVQQIDGHELFGTGINITSHPTAGLMSSGQMLKDIKVIYDVNGRSAYNAQSTISPVQAIQHAANALGLPHTSEPAMIRVKPDGKMMFDKSNISLQDIPVEMGYMLTHSDELILTYVVQIESAQHGKYFQTIVNATDGSIITNDNLTLQCVFEDGFLHHNTECTPVSWTDAAPMAGPMMGGQYRVLPAPIESPNHGAFQLMSGIEDPTASPFGWHDTDGDPAAEFTYTRGNNVHAFLDRNFDYSPDQNVNGGASLIFDFPYNDAAEPVNNKEVSATNLFYWNNIMHDLAHAYGFDEASGNFQEHNYTGQGEDSDFIEAQAQFGDNNHFDCGQQANDDVPCVNNAYFTAPADGQNGRMVMFAWNRDNTAKFLEVLAPAEISGLISTGTAEFGPTISNVPVTGEVVIINDDSFDPTMGCYPVLDQPELAGKIALIDRGICDFSLKVYNAQEAGAIGAIVVNFEDVLISMGNGEQAGDVSIPSVFVSNVDGEKLRAAAGNGLTVTIVAPTSTGPLEKDGALDNGIVSHEYAHGISIRLTGGPTTINCLTPNGFIGPAEESYGMGEGWSDFFALAVTTHPGDNGSSPRGLGTFANKEGTNGRGIRAYPYSTDMSVNPLTYNYILQESMPHGVGAVWCAMIWDMYWALSDVYGWDPDLYHGEGGNNIAIQLVMDGLKLQGCNPGFIEARDAILMADMINNAGANQCLLWEVFARRGLGADAEGGDPDSRSDGREGFAIPTTCFNDLVITKTMTPEIIAGENIEVTLTITNYTNEIQTNVFVEDQIPAGTTYLPGSATIEPVVGSTLVWSLDNLAPDESITITYLLATNINNFSIQLAYDDIEGIADERWNSSFDPNGYIFNAWAQQDSIFHSGESAYRVGDVDAISQHVLETPEALHLDAAYPVYKFYTYYNTEIGADGGFVEILTETFPSWIRVDDRIFRNGYPGKLSYNTIAIPNLGAYSGRINTTNTMVPVYIDLRDFAGENVKMRFRFGTNDQNGGDGWYIDDVELMDAIIYNGQACVTSDQTPSVCAEADGRGTIVDSQIGSSTNEGHAADMILYPNPATDMLYLAIPASKTETSTITLYKITGERITSVQRVIEEGQHPTSISLEGMASGIYIVQVQTSTSIISGKFVKD
jgi:uncharacterized repeat protein (TIGR01451 family)